MCDAPTSSLSSLSHLRSQALFKHYHVPPAVHPPGHVEAGQLNPNATLAMEIGLLQRALKARATAAAVVPGGRSVLTVRVVTEFAAAMHILKKLGNTEGAHNSDEPISGYNVTLTVRGGERAPRAQSHPPCV